MSTATQNKPQRLAEYRMAPGEPGGVGFHPSEIAVLFNVEGPHRVQVLDVTGKVWVSEVGCGIQEHFFERTRFGRGIFFVRATVNGGSQLKRYFLDK
jgi:hypothetical protein